MASKPIELSRINMRLLHYFRMVAQELSFSRAAVLLHMSQPPLSMSIKELESILQTTLFDRSTRSVKLTQAGNALLRELVHIDSQMNNSLQLVQQLGRGEMGHIHIGAVGSAVWGGLLPKIKNFCETTPSVMWSMTEMIPIEQIAALRVHQIDLGVWRVVNGIAPVGFSCQLLEPDDFVLAVPEQHHLSQGDAVSLAKLAQETFIFMPMQEYGLGVYLQAACRQAGFNPNIDHVVNEPQTALALVAAGYGISLLPSCYAKIKWPNVQFCRLNERLPADLYAVYDEFSLTPTANMFLRSQNYV